MRSRVSSLLLLVSRVMASRTGVLSPYGPWLGPATGACAGQLCLVQEEMARQDGHPQGCLRAGGGSCQLLLPHAHPVCPPLYHCLLPNQQSGSEAEAFCPASSPPPPHQGLGCCFWGSGYPPQQLPAWKVMSTLAPEGQSAGHSLRLVAFLPVDSE